MKKNILKISLVILCGAIVYGCTKLNEKILDEASAAGLTEKQIAEGNIAPVYAKLPDIFLHTNYFELQQISTDEAILPYRGGTDWGDNGIYISLHKHESNSQDPNIRSTWNHLTQGISRAVTAMDALPNNKDANAKTFLAEARGMKAYYNMLMLDLFGLAFQKETSSDQSKVLRGDAAVSYIRSELLAVEPQLETGVGPGRLTKAGVWGLLARLYLNSAVYRDIYGTSFTF